MEKSGDLGVSTQVRFRSKWAFLTLRALMVSFVPVAVAVIFAEGAGPAGTAIASLLMLTVIVGLLYRLLRACLIVDGAELISRGYFRDRHFPKSQVVGAAVAPTWYTWRRLVVPATLFLVLDGGKRVRIPGVQCHIGNIGVSHAPIEEEIQRSYPQEVAGYLNTIVRKPVDLSG